MTAGRAIDILNCFLCQAVHVEEYLVAQDEDEFDPDELRATEEEIEALSMAIRALEAQNNGV